MTKFETILENLANDRQLLARFIHTLSFLEYIGARKILKSQKAETVDLEVLSHASEEIRHARVYKKLAEEIAGHSLGGYCEETLLCGSAAEVYFQTVDSESGKAAGNPSSAYALTTLLVEERTLKLYPQLEGLLAKQGFSGRVAGILKEEEKHLEAIRRRIATNPTIANCHALEDKAFQKLLEELARNSGGRTGTSEVAGPSPMKSG